MFHEFLGCSATGIHKHSNIISQLIAEFTSCCNTNNDIRSNDFTKTFYFVESSIRFHWQNLFHH